MAIPGISPQRRRFLRQALGSAPAVGLLAGGAGVASVAAPAAAYQPTYFTSEEWGVLCAAVDRLIPPSEDGPGALQAGVHEFIDRQMNTPYAHGALWYMQAPFVAAAPEFGYQFHMNPRQLYRSALPGLNQAARRLHGKPYAELEPARRDAMIGLLEKNTLDIGPVPAQLLFGQLLQNTHEGYFCDPKHGGNKDMAAWRMIGFPGARADYMDWVEQYGVQYPLPPAAIA
jgi:gluconate 2-dehydrogenase gamma chain